MSFLLERDGLNGKAGKGFATIDGRNVELFGLKKFEANAEFNKADFPVVGTKTVQQKLTNMKISGSFTIFMLTSQQLFKFHVLRLPFTACFQFTDFPVNLIQRIILHLFHKGIRGILHILQKMD